MNAGVIGGSGYLGAELLRLLAGHPDFEVGHLQAQSAAGKKISEVHPGLSVAYGKRRFEPIDAASLLDCDVVFLAVPSGASRGLVAELYKQVDCVVDLAADYRLHSPELYERWYGFHHDHPELLAEAVYGLPELNRTALESATLIAAPGCYPTAAALSLAPLVEKGIIEPMGIVVDAASGTSGAGREPTAGSHHALVNENFTAYKVLEHRHTPEIEQAIGGSVIFTAHLAPMTRGILTTSYGRAKDCHSTSDALEVLRQYYDSEPFVVVTDDIPSTRAAYGSNVAYVTARYDDRTGWVVAFGAIDNITKGGAGQAIQAANIALGLTETAGLPQVGIVP